MKAYRLALLGLLLAGCTVNLNAPTSINTNIKGEVNAPITADVAPVTEIAPVNVTAVQPTPEATPVSSPSPKTRDELVADCMEAGFGDRRRAMEAEREIALDRMRVEAKEMGYTDARRDEKLAAIQKFWDFEILRSSNEYLYKNCAR